MPEPIATWNSARGVWETAETSLLCEHSALYSGTWPTSGSMRNGRSYPPLTPGHRTGGSGSSSLLGLPTPTARLGDDTSRGADPARYKGPQSLNGRRSNLDDCIAAIGEQSPWLFKTPTAQLAINGGSQHPDKRRAGGHGPTLADQVEHELLPTPVTGYSQRTPEQWRAGRPAGNGATRERIGDLGIVVEHLLPTPVAGDGDRASATYARGNPTLAGALLPTPAAHDSGNSPEGHLAKKPGRSQVTSLQVIAEHGLIPSGGRLLPTPTAMDSHGARNATAERKAVKATTQDAGWTLSDVFWTGDLTGQPLSGGSES